MWLFSGAGTDAATSEELRVEADELQAKLSALRHAPGSALIEALPEEQQEAVRDTRFGSACDSEGGADVRRSSSVEAAVHYDLGDDGVESPGKSKNSDLMAMYDFSGFKTGCIQQSSDALADAVMPQGQTKPLSKKAQLRAERKAELERLQALEQALRARNEELEIQMEQQERKLTAATRSVAKTRKQAAQLTAQVGLQDIKGSKNSKEVEQLRVLLAERECQLQDALDECDNALSVNTRTEAVGDDEAQPPQEATAAALSPEDEESLQQLLRITEDLTDALETSRAGEDELRRELATTQAVLEREEARAMESRKRMEEAKEAKDMEVSMLQARLKEKEQALAAERARCIALEVGAPPPKSDNRGVEPEGEPYPKVDRSDPEVEAAERAALAAIEVSKLHGSAARAGATASKVAGHLTTNATSGGFFGRLLGTRAQEASKPVPDDAKQEASKSTVDALDWTVEPMEV